MAAGVYMIQNTVNSKCYVGSAVDIDARRDKHFTKLRRGEHASRHMQASWKKYGEQSFVFETLEEVENPTRESLLACENKWILRLRPKYNKRLVADSNLGLPMPLDARLRNSRAVQAYRQTPEGQAHGEKLREATKASWADPVRREQRIAAIKAAWTSERRHEAGKIAKARASHILEDGTHFGARRQWTEADRMKVGKLHKERWAERAPVSEEDIRALVKSTNPAWTAVEMTGTRSVHKVLIRCSIHQHDQWQTIAKLKHEHRGCRLCGFQRSSDSQKGRPKTSSLKKGD